MNLTHYLETSAQRFPDKIAVRFEGQTITFQELNTNCSRLAAGLQKMGLSTKDCCALIVPNSIHAITAHYALAKLGVLVVPINFLYRENELSHIFSDSKPKAFIGAEPYLEEIRKVFKTSKETPIRLTMGSSDNSEFKDFNTAYSTETDFSTYPADDDDVLNILYTSGTTGVPKGVMLTHGNLASEARILAEMRGKLDPEVVVIGVLPLYHVYGITSVLNVSMYLGLTIELFTQFEPQNVMRVVEEEKQTILFAVPTMYNRLIQLATESPPVHPSLKFCVSGGASLPVEFLHRFESLFNTKIYEGYGLTEAPVCVENPYGGLTKPGSIGLPIPEFSAKIVDPDGKDVPRGETGELIIKGPGVMKGYLNRPKETSETIKEGWLYTGDIARMDEDNYIYIVDRKKDLIIRGGYNVYPREIEEVMYQIPEILEAAVLGVPHDDLGEEIAAIVVLVENADIDADAIQKYVKARVAPYKYPRIIRITQEPFPKSGTGKILKKEIRKQYYKKRHPDI
ncbi:MAG: long-chain fatty acid--CoA ligase [Desulfobacterales bacterium]|nr:MAG: long-chain fatty acid--CoA ligase [Desulfobacterales bacterium]